MNKTLKLLLEELNNNNEDFELYPTTEEMIKCIWNHRRQQYSDKSGVKSFR